MPLTDLYLLDWQVCQLSATKATTVDHRKDVSGGSVRIKTPDGKTVEQRNVPVGVVFWSEAETHSVENISGSNVRTLIIELKTGKA